MLMRYAYAADDNSHAYADAIAVTFAMMLSLFSASARYGYAAAPRFSAAASYIIVRLLIYALRYRHALLARHTLLRRYTPR